MSSLLAIAALTWRAVWRLRAGWLLVLLLGTLLALPLGPGGAEVLILGLLGPGQTLLVIAALWLAADLASREFEDQTILLLAVRPVSHQRILLGRWLGLLACELPLLLLLAVGLALRAGAGPAGSAAIEPVLPDFAAEADRIVAEKGALNGLTDPVAREAVRRSHLGAVRAKWQTVPPWGHHTWRFATLPAAGDALSLELIVRTGESVEAVEGRLRIGPPGEPGPRIDLLMIPNEPCRVDLRGLPTGTRELEVRFENPSSRLELAFPPEDGPRIVWREASFTGNLVRLLGVVAGQLAFLSAVGLALGSLLSFPVAAFCGLGYLVGAGLIGLVAQRLTAPAVFLGRQGIEQPWLERLSQLALHGGYWLTAPLNLCRPVADLAAGVAIAAADVWSVALGWGLLGSLLVLRLGGWLLERREIGGLVA